MFKSEPLVSIIVPCYNHEMFVKDCIQSVINQSYKNIELIVIDDGSKDHSIKAIEELVPECKKRFVRFEFRSRPNKGLSYTLNEALDWIEGKYMACIASDDMIIEDKTALQVDYLENHTNIIAVFGGVELIDIENKVMGLVKAKEGSRSFKDLMLHGSRILAPTQMMLAKAVREVGGYNNNLLIEDGYMWLKLSQIGNLQVLTNTFALYRRHETNISSDFEKMHNARFQLINEFRDSEYYDIALNRVKWSIAYDFFMHNKKGKALHLAQMLYLNPTRTLKGIFKKAFNLE